MTIISDDDVIYTIKDLMEERQTAINEVVAIIDKHGQQLISDIIDCKFQEIKAANVLASVREDVLALKGGEHEDSN